MNFPTQYDQILARVEAINPLKYASTRNYLHGAVSYLSPYISRGVISTRQVLESLLNRGFQRQDIEKFVQELAWRDYFQLVWEVLGDKIMQDIKQPQPHVMYAEMAQAVVQASTGIEAIDQSIKTLYETGYMHNHARMYVSSLVCNVGKAHWKVPARWLYYHLLDADGASNACGWQWVAGAFSTKKYYANQENINRYTGSRQGQTFLDKTYEQLPHEPIPSVLMPQVLPTLPTELPKQTPLDVQSHLPTLVYNAYNLDPLWHTGEEANRILLLEPSHFAQYPMCSRTIEFILALAQNIAGIQCFVGEFQDLKNTYYLQDIIFKKHPAFAHYAGKAEERAYMFPELQGYYPSFFNYWGKCEKYFKKMC